MIKVEKGIPIPPINTKARGRKRKYPFDTMSVGDSFVVPKNSRKSITKSARYAKRKVVTRTEGKNVRVWCVA